MTLSELEKLCHASRIEIIKMLYEAQSGHAGGSLSAVEIMTALYFKIMKVRPEEPSWEGRDRFILSKGHASPVLYVTLAMAGYFDSKDLYGFRKLNNHLQGHPNMLKTPGVDFSSGSLGQGLSVGLGMALGYKMKAMPNRVYVLLGDGEMNEGQNWEAIMSAPKYELNNLVAILDYNKVQLDGTAEEIMDMMPMREKWEAFKWHVIEIDGHSMEEVLEAFAEAEAYKKGPSVIIAHTVKGKGVSFMEGKYQWHGQPIKTHHYEQALKELCGEEGQYGNLCN